MSKNFDVSLEKQDQILRGERIKYIREHELKLNKTDLAKQIGISSQFLGLVEEGKGNLTYRSIKLLRNLSGHSADYILFGKNTNLEHETNVILSTFTDEQIELGCDTLKKLAVFIKSIN